MTHDGAVIVVAGGQTSADEVTLTVEMLELSTSIWHKMPKIPNSVIGSHAVKLNPGLPHGHGDFALVGGNFEHSEILQFVRRSQFQTGNEATERSLSVPRRYAAILVASPRLVCV